MLIEQDLYSATSGGAPVKFGGRFADLLAYAVRGHALQAMGYARRTGRGAAARAPAKWRDV
jgi:hypothetical protein